MYNTSTPANWSPDFFHYTVSINCSGAVVIGAQLAIALLCVVYCLYKSLK